jgi:hypothetical protein
MNYTPFYVVYTFVALLTFGGLHYEFGHKPKGRLLMLVLAALLWPAYWIIWLGGWFAKQASSSEEP